MNASPHFVPGRCLVVVACHHVRHRWLSIDLGTRLSPCPSLHLASSLSTTLSISPHAHIATMSSLADPASSPSDISPDHTAFANGSASNPILGLVLAIIYALLYLLQWTRSLIAWITFTITSILQYSLTISLNFPTLLGLFIAGATAAVFVIRYRYLARYTQLKEPALPPPSPPSLTSDFPGLASAGLTEKGGASFHSYLDDFLSAIRIFGYLEKPVFHELSRHLETRRLAAGDTLEISDGDFWCVVEGKVQVVSPTPPLRPCSQQVCPANRPSRPCPSPFARPFRGQQLVQRVSPAQRGLHWGYPLLSILHPLPLHRGHQALLAYPARGRSRYAGERLSGRGRSRSSRARGFTCQFGCQSA